MTALVPLTPTSSSFSSAASSPSFFLLLHPARTPSHRRPFTPHDPLSPLQRPPLTTHTPPARHPPASTQPPASPLRTTLLPPSAYASPPFCSPHLTREHCPSCLLLRRLPSVPFRWSARATSGRSSTSTYVSTACRGARTARSTFAATRPDAPLTLRCGCYSFRLCSRMTRAS